jgi:hypothetical protein
VFAAVTGAVGAAIHFAVGFEPVTDDAALTVIALRRERMYGAFERVKRHGFVGHRDLKALIVVVPANVAFHRTSPLMEIERMGGGSSLGMDFSGRAGFQRRA